MTPYKSNHIVAKGILKNFKDHNGNFFYFSKITNKPIKHRNIDKVFCNDFLYWLQTDELGPTAVFEYDYLQKIDKQASELFGKILNSEVEYENYQLSQVDKVFLAKFLLVQRFRTPAQMNSLINRDGDRNRIKTLLKQSGKKYLEELEKLDDKKLKQISKFAHFTRYAHLTDNDVAILSNKDFAIFNSQEIGRSFIIGDSAISIYPNENADLHLSDTGIFMPISPNIMIGLCGNKKVNMYIDVDEEFLEHANQITFGLSTQVASNNKNEIGILVE